MSVSGEEHTCVMMMMMMMMMMGSVCVMKQKD